MQYRLLQLYIAILVLVSSVIIFPFVLLTWLLTVAFDPKLVWVHKISCFWTVLYIRLVPNFQLSRIGLENHDPKKNYMMVSNHQSFIDILMGNYLMLPFKWVSKIEAFSLPFFGWAMRLNRYIAIKRGDKESVKQMMLDSEKQVKKGCSLFIFPEGTRSQNQNMAKFKPGAFILAKKLKLPILPIVIKGTADAMKKEGYNFKAKRAMSVEVLPAISPEQYANMSLKELTLHTQELINQALITSPDYHDKSVP